MKQSTSFMKPLLVIAIIMLLLGMLSGWPYGYYTLLRLVVFVTSCLITIAAYKMQKNGWAIGIGFIAILFNPFMLVHLDKAIWRVVDFIVAVIFLNFLLRMRKNESQ